MSVRAPHEGKEASSPIPPQEEEAHQQRQQDGTDNIATVVPRGGNSQTQRGARGRTVSILSPWSNPVPLTRSWCLWEIFCTRMTESKSFMVEAKHFEKALMKDFDSILGSLSKIDVKMAEAFKKEDQEKILALVEGMAGGAHELNKAVLAEMRAWTAYGPGQPQGSGGTVSALLGGVREDAGAEHQSTLQSLNNLGVLLKKQGKLAEAEPLYRRNLEGSEKTLGAEHPFKLTSVSNLGLLLQDQGKLAEAEPLYCRDLQAKEKTLDAEHQSTLTSVNNLAQVVDRSQRGLVLCPERLLAPLQSPAVEARPPPACPDPSATCQGCWEVNVSGCSAPSVFSLPSRSLRYRGSASASLPCCFSNTPRLLTESPAVQRLGLRRALQEREKTVGAEHPDTLTSVNNLGMLLKQQGKLAEAEPLFRRDLEGSGAEHPFTLTSVNNLAGLLMKRASWWRRAFVPQGSARVREDARGRAPEHPDTLSSVYNLAYLLEKQGKLAEAEALYRRELQGCEKTLGAEHPDTLSSVRNLARFLEQQGKLAEAEPLYRRAQEAEEIKRNSFDEPFNQKSEKLWTRLTVIFDIFFFTYRSVHDEDCEFLFGSMSTSFSTC
eukprot:g42040.t1